MRACLLLLALGAAAPACLAQTSSVVNSKHNLSAFGAGAVRAATESEVCIFCHTPHNATPIRPLWNRQTPVEAYAIYASRALDAQPGQPTGTSKMCLSCHDGTIAVGAVVSRASPIMMAGGLTTLPPGSAANLGTALVDDHPISFRFDSALAARDPKLKDPALLRPETRLDPNGELQCTTCHDAHDDSRGKFLVMRNTNSELCISCHQVGTTGIAAHQACAACHQPHSAPSGPYLLRRQTVTETCVTCHNGSITAAANLQPDLGKFSVHDTGSPVDATPPAPDHATCTSCHDPHTMMPGSAQPPLAQPSLGRIAGISTSGAPVAAASYEHEVCYSCHADTETRAPFITRKLVQPNKRLQFGPQAVSYHPVGAPGVNPDVPSLRPGLTTASVMSCSSCHASDTGQAAGGSGPDGVHGSNQAPLLLARYDTADYSSESQQTYALCYTCHDRASILADRSFPSHRRHIVDLQAPCAACHDAHGISTAQGSITGNSNLINFATLVVTPDRVTNRLEFRDLGTYRGECFLSCHGADHSPRGY